MFDSLAYRNDAAIVMRRLIRSLPTASGVIGIATCDKGLPATMLALAGVEVTARRRRARRRDAAARIGAEDAGQVQSLGARFARDLITLDYAAEMGCRACGSSGGGCQFLGTAATSQVVAEAFGLALPHSALAPSGEPAWLELGARSAIALDATARARDPARATSSRRRRSRTRCSCTRRSADRRICCCTFRRSRTRRACAPPTVDDWIRINRATPRLVDALPNGPRGHPTVQVFMAGGVPEVMLHLRRMGLLQRRRAHRDRRHARHDARLVGAERAAAARARAARVPARRSRPTT